jgi:hypothetical protein
MITDLNLDRHELVAGSSEERDLEINISTSYADPENDVVTFNYNVTAGKIVGAGAKVRWALSEVEPGVDTITAGVNDGSGILATITARVEILECATCRLRETE